MLYYVDIIRRIPETEMTEMVLLRATGDNDNDGIQIRVPATRLRLNNGREVVETDYVYYEPDREQMFQNGNHSTFARRQRQLYARYRKLLQSYSQEHHAEDFNSRNFVDDTHTMSYHVNVGHGNCSIIVNVRGGFYTIWMVDCSVFEIGNNKHYSQNIEASIDQIANDLNINRESIKISVFMLTHAHYDHYNGLEYLIDHGYLQSGAVIYQNQWYHSPSPTMVRILKKMVTLKCIIKEPLRDITSPSPIHILYPECRIYKRHPSINPPTQYRIESNTNNSSVVYHIGVGVKSMILPGDLEFAGINRMTNNRFCQTQYFYAQYYCISHHGSLTGHINLPCLGHSMYPNVLRCKQSHLSKAILMGRNGAFSGIYSPKVLSDFSNVLVYTEQDNNGNPIQFFRLDWDTSNVYYF